jgi:hypothetical protein
LHPVDLTVVKSHDRVPVGVALGPRELLLGSSVLVVAVLVIGPVTDLDYWWHVQTGRWILAHWSLPGRDLYTFMAVGHPWIDHEYLTEVLMWLLQSHLGLVGVSAALGLVTLLGFVLLLRTAELLCPWCVVLAPGLVLAALAGMPVWGTRPQMITFALACLELYWLRRYVAGTGRAIRWFPLVMVAWANLHGGWVIAFVFLGLAVLSELMHWAVGAPPPALRAPSPSKWGRGASPSDHLDRARHLGVVALLSAGAVACTPNGVALYLYPLRTQASSAQQRFISEWQTPNLHEVTFLPFFAMLLLLVVGFSLRRPRTFDLLVSVTTLALALLSLRHIPLFVAAATPSLVSSWSDTLRPARSWLRARIGPAAPRPALTVTTAAALCLVAVAVGSSVVHSEERQKQVVRQLYPVAAVDRLMAGPARCDRIFNDYGWGGYLIDRLSPDPRRRIFIFGEADVMGDPLIYLWKDIYGAGPAWRENLDRSGADCVLVPPDAPLAGALAGRPGWRLAYSDRVAVLYVRPPYPYRLT